MTHDAQSISPPSRSQQRRQALEILKLSEELTALSPGQRARLPLSPELRTHLSHTDQISSPIARKRERAFLAKQLRRQPEDALMAIVTALRTTKDSARQHNAALQRAETWRTRLLNEGDACLEDLRRTYPDADIHALRQLIRNARKQQERNKPPRAFKEIFRILRALDSATVTQRTDPTNQITDQ